MDNPALAESALVALESMRYVVELCAGYKAMCQEAGFTEAIAEVMASHYHASLIAMLAAAT